MYVHVPYYKLPRMTCLQYIKHQQEQQSYKCEYVCVDTPGSVMHPYPELLFEPGGAVLSCRLPQLGH